MSQPLPTRARKGSMRLGFANPDTGFSQYRVPLKIAGDQEKEAVVAAGLEELARKKSTIGVLQARLDKGPKRIDYTDDIAFWQQLLGSSGATKLVSARWLVAYAKQKNATLPRRQDMPLDAFLKAEALQVMFNQAPKTRRGSERRLPILAVMEFWHELPRPFLPSEDGEEEAEGGNAAPAGADEAYDQYAVASDEFKAAMAAAAAVKTEQRRLERERILAMPPEYADCPDPDGKNLQALATCVREHLHVFSMFGFNDVGIFLDRVSCLQPPRALNEISMFKRSQRLSALLFAHALVTSVLCVDVPEEMTPLQKRGWPCFARACAWLVKECDGEDADWPRVLEIREGGSSVPSTKPPPPELGAFESGGSLSAEVAGVAFATDEERQLASECYDRALADALGGAQVLTYDRLGWGDAEMSALGKVLPLCGNTERLYLECNPDFTFLPDTLGSLRSLRTLFLTGCSGLQALPDSIGGLALLQSLYLAGCSELSEIPEALGDCLQLRELDLGRCTSVRALPERMGTLPSLHVLLLSGCTGLEALPQKMPPLVALYAAGCTRLTALPERLSGAPPKVPLIFTPRAASGARGEQMSLTLEVHVAREYPLRELRLFGCKTLTFLPHSLGALRQLEVLDLGSCAALPALPESLGGLAALERLNLRGCESLEAIPAVGTLHRLRELDLSGCCSLRALPDGLEALGSTLKLLRLEGCSLLPSAVRLTSIRPLKEPSRTSDLLGTRALLELMAENAAPEPEEEEAAPIAEGEEGDAAAYGADAEHETEDRRSSLSRTEALEEEYYPSPPRSRRSSRES